jgi:Uma2 family endonuclease
MTEMPELMTTEQLLALPDDGIDRELIHGRLQEMPMTRRNWRHSRTEASIAAVLNAWSRQQPAPRGEVLSGEAAFRILRNPDTTVGIDVAYISAEQAQSNPRDAFILEGPPVLAVEVLSPSDVQERLIGKIQDYLDGGVKLIWIVEPVFRTVTVYRPDAKPALFNDAQEIIADTHLPGFRVPVASLFGL